MFFCEVGTGRQRDFEKLAIFGATPRARRGAELKVLSAVETKVPGYLDGIRDAVVNRDKGKDLRAPDRIAQGAARRASQEMWRALPASSMLPRDFPRGSSLGVLRASLFCRCAGFRGKAFDASDCLPLQTELGPHVSRFGTPSTQTGKYSKTSATALRSFRSPWADFGGSRPTSARYGPNMARYRPDSTNTCPETTKLSGHDQPDIDQMWPGIGQTFRPSLTRHRRKYIGLESVKIVPIPALARAALAHKRPNLTRTP